MSAKKFTRRRFLRNTAAISSTALLAPYVRAQNLPATTRSAANKLNVAIIGTGGRGGDHVRLAPQAGANIVALCDIDQTPLDKAAAKCEGARTWRDFRKMLEQQKDIDAVIVATPDHTHAAAAIMAMELGKHVYVEKPLTHDLHELRVLCETAKKYPKLATQMGNQHHSGEGLHQAVELVRSGAIGKVRQVHCFTDRPIWPQGVARPTSSPVAPPTIEWDLWLGPAKEREYDPAYHPFKWRGWWDFGTGALGDMGCHIMDAAVWALGLANHPPRFVEPVLIRGGNSESAPKASIIKYEYANLPRERLVPPATSQSTSAPAPSAEPARPDRPEVTLFWYDGGELPVALNAALRERLGYDKLPPATNPSQRNGREEQLRNGTMFVGDNGLLFAALEGRPHFMDPDRDESWQPTAPVNERPLLHHQDWIGAATGEITRQPCSHFGYSGPLTELVLLGNLAIRTGKRIEWDSENLCVTNVPEANQYVRRECRKGWEL
jgi:predicted dehydrogenase